MRHNALIGIAAILPTSSETDEVAPGSTVAAEAVVIDEGNIAHLVAKPSGAA
jgi:hypothetical protein